MKREEEQELQDLAAKAVAGGEGAVTDAEFDRLQFLLRDDSDCRVAYHQFCQLHLGLMGKFGAPDDHGAAQARFVTDATSGNPGAIDLAHEASPRLVDLGARFSRRSKRAGWRGWVHPSRLPSISLVGCAAAACLIGVLLGQWSATHRRDPTADRESDSFAAVTLDSLQSVATITSGVAPGFREGHKVGDRLSAGKVTLERGVAEILFDHGAVLVLEGPSELIIVDRAKCFLASGSLTALVSPDARGFVIQTDEVQVSEFDADFGLSSHHKQGSEVHVFRGELNLVALGNTAVGDEAPIAGKSVGRVTSHVVSRGQALRIDPELPAVTMDAKSSGFVTHKDLLRRRVGDGERACDSWRVYSHRWENDPATVLRYDFSATTDGSLPNLLAINAHSAISQQKSPRFIEGRWQGKTSMLFDGRTDMLTVADHPALRLKDQFTVAAWLRVRSVPKRFVRIVGKGTGIERNFGLWLGADGSLLWQVCQAGPPKSEKEWNRTSLHSSPIELDKWMLAVGIVTEDAIAFYLDGALQVARRISIDVATNNEPMTIGFYDEIPGHNGYFSGEMDELILLNRAMTSEEVREMYEFGRPDARVLYNPDAAGLSM